MEFSFLLLALLGRFDIKYPFTPRRNFPDHGGSLVMNIVHLALGVGSIRLH